MAVSTDFTKILPNTWLQEELVNRIPKDSRATLYNANSAIRKSVLDEAQTEKYHWLAKTVMKLALLYSDHIPLTKRGRSHYQSIGLGDVLPIQILYPSQPVVPEATVHAERQRCCQIRVSVRGKTASETYIRKNGSTTVIGNSYPGEERPENLLTIRSQSSTLSQHTPSHRVHVPIRPDAIEIWNWVRPGANRIGRNTILIAGETQVRACDIDQIISGKGRTDQGQDRSVNSQLDVSGSYATLNLSEELENCTHIRALEIAEEGFNGEMIEDVFCPRAFLTVSEQETITQMTVWQWDQESDKGEYKPVESQELPGQVKALDVFGARIACVVSTVEDQKQHDHLFILNSFLPKHCAPRKHKNLTILWNQSLMITNYECTSYVDVCIGLTDIVVTQPHLRIEFDFNLSPLRRTKKG